MRLGEQRAALGTQREAEPEEGMQGTGRWWAETRQNGGFREERLEG